MQVSSGIATARPGLGRGFCSGADGSIPFVVVSMETGRAIPGRSLTGILPLESGRLHCRGFDRAWPGYQAGRALAASPNGSDLHKSLPSAMGGSPATRAA